MELSKISRLLGPLVKSAKWRLACLTSLLLLIGCGSLFAQDLRLPDASESVESCPANPDRRYKRADTLLAMAKVLEDSIPEYKTIFSAGFGVENDQPRGFFVFDLMEPFSKEKPPGNCVNLIDGHVYHFAPLATMFSFSHIMVLENGQMRVFRSVNCRNRGDSLRDVLNYLENCAEVKVVGQPTIIDRVKRYREYGIYSKIDDEVPLCELEVAPV